MAMHAGLTLHPRLLIKQVYIINRDDGDNIYIKVGNKVF